MDEEVIILAFYIRVSTWKQAEEGYSLDAQLQACIKKAHEEFGPNVMWEVFKDEGISGKDLEHRPELQRMLRELKKGRFHGVITWKVSRLSRKLADALQIVESMSKSNIEFISIKEGRYNSAAGRLKFNLLASVAEYQREELAENVQLGMTQRASQGLWNGGKVLGYENKNKMLVPVSEEASIIRLMFNKTAEDNWGAKKLANWLNANGYRTKNGKPFTIGGVYLILKNPVYKGYIRFNQITNWNEKRRSGKNETPLLVKGVHEALVTEELWQKAQVILDSRASGIPRQYTGTFPLTGLAKCPQCGTFMTSMYGSKRKDGSKARYYVCGAYHNSGRSVCGINGVRADRLEEAVWERLTGVLTNDDILEELTSRINALIDQKNSFIPEDESQHLRQRLKALEEQKRRVQAGFENQIYTMAEATEKLKPLRASIGEIEKQLDCVSGSSVGNQFLDLQKVTPDILRRQLVEFLELKNHLEAKEFRELLQACIQKIEIQGKALNKVYFSFVLEKNKESNGTDSESDPEDPVHNQLERYILYRATFLAPKRHLFVIRFTPQNADTAIQLFDEHDSGQLVWQSNGSEAPAKGRPLANRFIESI